MSQLQRYWYKFTSIGGSLSYTFPLNLYEAESMTPLRGQLQDLVGASGAHDFHGISPWPKGPASHVIRFAVVGSATPQDLDDTVDEIRGVLYPAGLGKLWSTDADGDERWMYARITKLPDRAVQIMGWVAQPLALDFLCPDPTIYGETLSTYTTDVTVGQSPKSLTWNNPGNARMRLHIIAQALASGGYASGFTITNSTTGHSITTTRASASTDSRVELDGPRQRIRHSTDAGVSWADDYASATIPAIQRDFAIDLEPGDNSIVITVAGTPNVRITATAFPAWQ